MDWRESAWRKPAARQPATWIKKAQALSPELQAALGPLLQALESLSERIADYNQQIEAVAQQRYPQAALLKQIKGVGDVR